MEDIKTRRANTSFSLDPSSPPHGPMLFLVLDKLRKATGGGNIATPAIFGWSSSPPNTRKGARERGGCRDPDSEQSHLCEVRHYLPRSLAPTSLLRDLPAMAETHSATILRHSRLGLRRRAETRSRILLAIDLPNTTCYILSMTTSSETYNPGSKNIPKGTNKKKKTSPWSI